MNKNFFCINVKDYNKNFSFEVGCPSSIDNPKSHSVMFLNENYVKKWKQLLMVEQCLVFWPEIFEVPEEVKTRHVVITCKNPRLEYCRFFKENNIKNLPKKEDIQVINGAMIAKNSKVGKNSIIMPSAYVSSEVEIGDNVYIGVGVKLIGKIKIGNDVIIRENSVLGADGLSTDRDSDGTSIIMPQFGGIRIDNQVTIGCNCVIARGAIDNTIIEKGCKIDNSVFISHNVHIGKDTFIVGETIMFGSSSTGERVYISGNSTIRNKVKIGSDVMIGMGSVVTRNIEDGEIVYGNPAHGGK